MQFPWKKVEPERAIRITRNGAANVILVAAVVVVGLIAGTWLAFSKTRPEVVRTEPSDYESGALPTAEPAAGEKMFPVNIRKPIGPPRVFTGINDIHGQPVTVGCSTCHATRQPNFENKSVADLNEFHGSLAFAHGTVSCLGCHNATDYDALKLADGSRVEYTNVMTLCAQCHGLQMRDYQHGAHGGFNGHWDLTRGPQEKNNCIDCHNPHSPKFPKMQPTFKPRDRFLEDKSHKGHE